MFPISINQGLQWVDITAATSSLSNFFFADSTVFPAAAAADDGDEDASVEVAGLTSWAGVEVDVLTMEVLAAASFEALLTVNKTIAQYFYTGMITTFFTM